MHLPCFPGGVRSRRDRVGDGGLRHGPGGHHPADGEAHGAPGHPGGGDPLPEGLGQDLRGQAQGEPARQVPRLPQEAARVKGATFYAKNQLYFPHIHNFLNKTNFKN